MTGPALAQVNAHEGHTEHAPEAAADLPGSEGSGQIKALDAKSGKVTIHHAPIPTLGWPAMTMTFQAAPELLKALKVGQDVKFTVRTPGNQITAIQAQ
ncbi:MAG: copper-binding protein [Proteobacteria bacterium]|nr:copper-binding protein [Pseudomonadota bacterium]